VDWQAGKGYMGGSACLPPGEKTQKILRAIDIQTGKIAWELPEAGPGESWGGASPRTAAPTPLGATPSRSTKSIHPTW